MKARPSNRTQPRDEGRFSRYLRLLGYVTFARYIRLATLALFAYIAVAIISRPPWREVLGATFTHVVFYFIVLATASTLYRAGQHRDYEASRGGAPSVGGSAGPRSQSSARPR